LNVPLDSGERSGVQGSFNKILEFGRSEPKITIGSPQCSISRGQVTRDLLGEGKEMLAHALQTSRSQPSLLLVIDAGTTHRRRFLDLILPSAHWSPRSFLKIAILNSPGFDFKHASTMFFAW
jgi:hypothetical protein